MENQEKNPTGLKWNPTETFEITGAQLNAIVVALDEEMKTPEMQRFLRIFMATQASSDVVKKGMEQGKIEQTFE